MRINNEYKDSIEFLKEPKVSWLQKENFYWHCWKTLTYWSMKLSPIYSGQCFHLMEELEKREDVKHLPPTDYQHLSGDTVRVYSLMTQEWLQYMEHLKNNYPYLFSWPFELIHLIHNQK